MFLLGLLTAFAVWYLTFSTASAYFETSTFVPLALLGLFLAINLVILPAVVAEMLKANAGTTSGWWKFFLSSAVATFVLFVFSAVLVIIMSLLSGCPAC